LIPRWLSGWGLVAIGLSAVATVYAGFTQDFGFTTVDTVLSIPLGEELGADQHGARDPGDEEGEIGQPGRAPCG
jgi:hypothetical protein